jgi:hypothetical protein
MFICVGGKGSAEEAGAASGGKGDGPSERRGSDMMGVDVRASRSDMQVDW